MNKPMNKKIYFDEDDGEELNAVDIEEKVTQKKWYEEISDDVADAPKVTDEELIKLKDEAKKCNDADVATYNIRNAKTNSEYKWMKTVMSKGTASDKTAANTLLIQDNPLCNLNTIRDLVLMIKAGNKKGCFLTMDTVTELFLSDLLRPDKKLKPFYDRPLSKLDELSSGNATTRRKYLSYWYFEDQLKEIYTMFVQAVNSIAHDTVEINRVTAVRCMHNLLAGNPEQEKNLLANIVNKLGDSSQKIGSKALYCLGLLLRAHPNMKQVVLNEIERLLFRPNISPRAQYYGICYLTQFCLNPDDIKVARNLITVYFSFFKACIKKGEIDSRMMSALLTGVNRAYPFAQTEFDKLFEHIETMYKIIHMSSFTTGVHALNLLYHVSLNGSTLTDRFYTALYRKLLDPEVIIAKNQAMFLNLVFRALKRDPIIKRVRVFVKRLLQLSLFTLPQMTCAILFLIQHVVYKKPYLLALTLNPSKKEARERNENMELESENESDIENVYEQKKAEQNKSNRKNLPASDEDGDEEKPDIDVLNKSLQEEINKTNDKPIKKEIQHPEEDSYNPRHRNPLYAGGKFSAYTELLALQKHFHPTVALYATKILNGEPVSYSGDPLKDYSLIRFLERFAFKNPKQASDVEKPGINPVFAKRKMLLPKGVKAYGVTSNYYLNADIKSIPIEELFLYTYLQRKKKEREVLKQEDEDSDIDSVTSEEFEEMLDRMSGFKKADDEDDDLDFMKDVGSSLKKTKTGKIKNDDGSEGEEDDEGEDSDDEDEEEAEFSGEENFSDDEADDKKPLENGDDEDDFGIGDMEDIEDEDFSDIDFDSDGEINEKNPKSKSKPTKKGKKTDDSEYDDEDDDLNFDDDEDDDGTFKELKNKLKMKLAKKGKRKDDLDSVFASADEFASLLEQESDPYAGTSDALSNTDNAHMKQLAWEKQRDRWIKGHNKGFSKGKGKGKKHFQNKEQYTSKKRQKKFQQGNKNKKQKKR